MFQTNANCSAPSNRAGNSRPDPSFEERSQPGDPVTVPEEQTSMTVEQHAYAFFGFSGCDVTDGADTEEGARVAAARERLQPGEETYTKHR